jgi:hypothetical protein
MRPLLFTAILSATLGFGQAGDPPPTPMPRDAAPQMTDISQKTAKPGEMITVSGLGLSAKNIDEIYLTDHRFDMRVKVIEQKDTTITFRVPPFAKPGRMQMLFLTRGDEPKLLEQPVYLLIEDPETEIAASKPSIEVNPGSLTTVESKPEPAKAEPVKDQAKPDAAKDQTKVDVKSDQKPDQTKPDQARQDQRQPK